MLHRAVFARQAVIMAAVVAAISVSNTASAQAQAYCWIDAQTGQAVSTAPISGANFVANPANAGAAGTAIIDPLNPNQASNSRTGKSFVRQPDGSWVDAQTGQAVSTAPISGANFVANPANAGAAGTAIIEPLNPNRASNPRTGRTFIRVPCPPPATQTSWTGPYGGAQAIGSWSRVSTNEFLAATGVQTSHLDDSGSGFGGGINGGYNWMPWGGNIVTGVVFDANGLSDKVNHTFPGGTFIGSTVNFEASADVRAGVLTSPNLLLYGQTGVSVADQRLQINFGGPITDTTQWTAGYNLGGGAEWMLPANTLPWGRSTSLFVSYDHTWWNKASLTMPAASLPFNYTWLRQSDAVEVGFRIRFGDPGVPVAPSGPMVVKALPPK